MPIPVYRNTHKHGHAHTYTHKRTRKHKQKYMHAGSRVTQTLCENRMQAVGWRVGWVGVKEINTDLHGGYNITRSRLRLWY